MFRKLLLTFAVLAGAVAFSPVAPVAEACPMCKLANESGTSTQEAAVVNARPKAYMYSILFMLSMPATLLAAFGLSFYRIHRRHQADLAAAGDSDGASLLAEPTPA